MVCAFLLWLVNAPLSPLGFPIPMGLYVYHTTGGSHPPTHPTPPRSNPTDFYHLEQERTRISAVYSPSCDLLWPWVCTHHGTVTVELYPISGKPSHVSFPDRSWKFLFCDGSQWTCTFVFKRWVKFFISALGTNKLSPVTLNDTFIHFYTKIHWCDLKMFFGRC